MTAPTLTLDPAATGSPFDAVLTRDFREIEGIFRHAGHQLRVVGGTVRDLVLGGGPPDTVNLCTDAPTAAMVDCLSDAGIRWLPTDLSYQTVTVLADANRYEITGLRYAADPAREGEDPQRGFRTDASHRDFTFNALYLSVDGTLHDYFHGVADLKASRVRFIGDPDDRIAEDPVRIPRYFRFHGCLPGTQFDTQIDAPIIRNLDRLDNLSPERVWAEMKKILATPRAAAVIRKMTLLGVAEAIGLPEGNRKLLQARRLATDHPMALLISYLGHEADLDALAARWKWSLDERRLARLLVAHRTACPTLKQAQDAILDGGDRDHWAIALRMHDRPLHAEHVTTWKAPVCPLSGTDLLERGYRGSDLGAELDRLRGFWKASGYTLSREALLDRIG